LTSNDRSDFSAICAEVRAGGAIDRDTPEIRAWVAGHVPTL